MELLQKAWPRKKDNNSYSLLIIGSLILGLQLLLHLSVDANYDHVSVKRELIKQLNTTSVLRQLNFPNTIKHFYTKNQFSPNWIKSEENIRPAVSAMLLLDCVMQYSVQRKGYHPEILNYMLRYADLSESDLKSIHAVARLFCLHDLEIVLVDVNNKALNYIYTSENKFLNSVKLKLNYREIYYRHIVASKVNEGLIWLAYNGLVSILAIKHRHPTVLTRIVEGSRTKKLANTFRIPLLLLLEGKTPIG